MMNDIFQLVHIIVVITGILGGTFLGFYITWRCLKPGMSIIEKKVVIDDESDRSDTVDIDDDETIDDLL